MSSRIHLVRAVLCAGPQFPGLNPLLVSFPGTEQMPIAEVGGKGYSLILMVEAGYALRRGGGIGESTQLVPLSR